MEKSINPNTTLGQEASEDMLEANFCLSLLFAADSRRDELFTNQQPGQCLYMETKKFDNPEAYQQLLELMTAVFRDRATMDAMPVEATEDQTIVEMPGYLEVNVQPVLAFNVEDMVKLVADDPDLAERVHQMVMQSFYLDDAPEGDGLDNE